MTQKDELHYSKKNSPDFKPDPKVSSAIEKLSSDGKISCAGAFKVAKEKNISPAEVGHTLDFLEVRITHCQLGLYGYGQKKKIIQPLEAVSKELKERIEGSLVDGRLPCKSAWEIAERLGLGKMDVSAACETLKIKISYCQLGAF